MGGHHKRSKKLSGGKVESPPEDLVLYLDENLCDCRPIQEVLEKAGIKYERHLAYFSRGTPDETWLPFVGEQGWIVLGKDRHFRYNELERIAFTRHKVRSFEFASANLSKDQMASALTTAIPALRRATRKFARPFVVSISQGGSVTLRWPTEGTTGGSTALK